MDKWQPIEKNAPTDGRAFMGAWKPASGSLYEINTVRIGYNGQWEFLCEDNGGFDDLMTPPTHWRPLLEAPE